MPGQLISEPYAGRSGFHGCWVVKSITTYTASMWNTGPAPSIGGENVMRASQQNERALQMLWRHRIPRGMITVIAGRPGDGKGLVGRFIAAEVSRDRTVIMSSREDPIAEVVRPGLRLAGADLENVVIAGLHASRRSRRPRAGDQVRRGGACVDRSDRLAPVGEHGE